MSNSTQTVDLDEATVKRVIDWFEQEYPHSTGADKARKIFLPEKSKAKDLSDQYEALDPWADSVPWKTAVRNFARWLETEGKLA